MSLASIIIETRPIKDLGYIIRDHLKMLPENNLYMFHGRHNERAFIGLKGKKFEVNVNTLRDYNALLTSTFFWDRFLSYEHVLIFQNDSMILRHGLEEFYDWDYVGAPWIFQEHGGNGGLSLRNPNVMYKTLTRVPYNIALGYEDVYFCNHMEGKLAPREVCEKFSCETIFKLGTWGYHAIENYMNNEQIKEIKNQYKVIA